MFVIFLNCVRRKADSKLRSTTASAWTAASSSEDEPIPMRRGNGRFPHLSTKRPVTVTTRWCAFLRQAHRQPEALRQRGRRQRWSDGDAPGVPLWRWNHRAQLPIGWLVGRSADGGLCRTAPLWSRTRFQGIATHTHSLFNPTSSNLEQSPRYFGSVFHMKLFLSRVPRMRKRVNNRKIQNIILILAKGWNSTFGCLISFWNCNLLSWSIFHLTSDWPATNLFVLLFETDSQLKRALLTFCFVADQIVIFCDADAFRLTLNDMQQLDYMYRVQDLESIKWLEVWYGLLTSVRLMWRPSSQSASRPDVHFFSLTAATFCCCPLFKLDIVCLEGTM